MPPKLDPNEIKVGKFDYLKLKYEQLVKIQTIIKI